MTTQHRRTQRDAHTLTHSAPRAVPPPLRNVTHTPTGNHTRETMSPLFRPVPRDLDVSTAGGDVARYFPNLAEVCGL